MVPFNCFNSGHWFLGLDTQVPAEPANRARTALEVRSLLRTAGAVAFLPAARYPLSQSDVNDARGSRVRCHDPCFAHRGLSHREAQVPGVSECMCPSPRTPSAKPPVQTGWRNLRGHQGEDGRSWGSGRGLHEKGQKRDRRAVATARWQDRCRGTTHVLPAEKEQQNPALNSSQRVTRWRLTVPHVRLCRSWDVISLAVTWHTACPSENTCQFSSFTSVSLQSRYT